MGRTVHLRVRQGVDDGATVMRIDNVTCRPHHRKVLAHYAKRWAAGTICPRPTRSARISNTLQRVAIWHIKACASEDCLYRQIKWRNARETPCVPSPPPGRHRPDFMDDDRRRIYACPMQLGAGCAAVSWEEG